MIEKNISREILSDITVFNKYAKYLPTQQRRENWKEIVDRNVAMHLEKFPQLEKDIRWAYQFVYDKKILPSMRSLQFAGPAAKVNPARLYNCAFMNVDDIRVFQETMFMLLSGCGIGYSVQKHHIAKLPEIRKPNPKRHRRYVISDDISGWADAVKMLIKSYFGKFNFTIDFDYSDIRPKGALLVTSGGVAPGPGPLKECIVKMEGILSQKQDGDKLTTLEAHTLMCFIADAVLSGGIRRAALIALFSIDDKSMLSCKSGHWWELHPEYGRANNSAILVRSLIKRDDFDNIWEYIQKSGSGEPGISWTNNPELGFNPCFSYDTPILTAYGYKNIGDLENQEVELINHKGEIVNGTVFKSGEKAIFKINLSNKTSIKTTINHRFMLTDGSEKEIQFISKEDRLMPFYKMNYEVNTFTKLGFIQGDGSTCRLSSNSHKGLEVHIGENDLDVSKLFEVDGSGNHYLNGYNEVMRELGFSSKPLPERKLPTTLRTWSEYNIRMFLKGLYSANGSIITNHRISFKSTCLDLIYEMKDLLLSKFNIDSYYTTNKAKEVDFTNGTYLCKESYDLNITTLDSVLKFAELIGFVHTYKQTALENLILIKAPKVISSKVCDVESVYDFTLFDNTHWGVINGVIAHNCHEISLKDMQCCNLTEINASDVESQEDLNNRAQAAAIIGTLQASYTDFHYLRDNWQLNCEKDALLGVSMTGIASMEVFKYNIKEAAQIVNATNAEYASIIGINKAARTTTIKPAGTTSLVLGTSSGIHAWHDKYYWRRMRVNKNEAIYTYLAINQPQLLEDDFFNPETTAIIKVPQKSPDGAVVRTESALNLLDRVETITKEWIIPGYHNGFNQHNVSCTVSIKPDEWDTVKEWMWNKRDIYSGISILPYEDHNYVQAPFETCSEEDYNNTIKLLSDIDLTKVVEIKDSTDLRGEVACGGNGCEIK